MTWDGRTRAAEHVVGLRRAMASCERDCSKDHQEGTVRWRTRSVETSIEVARHMVIEDQEINVHTV